MGFFKSGWLSGKKKAFKAAATGTKMTSPMAAGAARRGGNPEAALAMGKITDLDKLSEIAIATADNRKREGKSFYNFEQFDRTMFDIGRAACQSDGDKSRAGALIEMAIHGWDFMFIAGKTGSQHLADETKQFAEVLEELEGKLPAEPEKQRGYINSIDTRIEYSGLHSANRKLIGCCLMIDALRPHAYDIARAVDTMSLRCDLRCYEDNPGGKSKELAAHERRCKAWKESAERLIALAEHEPETLYPVWGKLKKAINGAETQVQEKKQVGVKTIERRVAPDAPQDWTESVTVPDYKDVTEKKSMGLRFPAQ